MNPLSKVLEEAVKRLDIGEAAMEARAVMLWPEIVGPQMARASEAVKVQAGTLVVVTRSSSWSQEFSFQKETILRKYRSRLGAGSIKDLRFTVGRIRGVPAQSEARAPTDQELERIVLTPGERAQIDQGAAGSDPELAGAIRRALTREARLRRWHLQHGARACPACGAAYRSVHDRCPACRQDASRRGPGVRGRGSE